MPGLRYLSVPCAAAAALTTCHGGPWNQGVWWARHSTWCPCMHACSVLQSQAWPHSRQDGRPHALTTAGAARRRRLRLPDGGGGGGAAGKAAHRAVAPAGRMDGMVVHEQIGAWSAAWADAGRGLRRPVGGFSDGAQRRAGMLAWCIREWCRRGRDASGHACIPCLHLTPHACMCGTGHIDHAWTQRHHASQSLSAQRGHA